MRANRIFWVISVFLSMHVGYILADDALVTSQSKISAYFDKWMSSGFSDKKVPRKHAVIKSRPIENLNDVLYATADKTFLFTSSFPLLSDYDSWGILKEINKAVAESCAESNGELINKPSMFMKSRFTTQQMRNVFTTKWTGDFACLDQDKNKIFEVDVGPYGNETDKNLGWIIDVQIWLFDTALFKEHQQILTIFRGSIKSGDSVSIRDVEVPMNAKPDLLKSDMPPAMALYDFNKNMDCGLIIDAKDTLVQIQVGSTSFYTSRDKIFPSREKFVPGKYSEDKAICY